MCERGTEGQREAERQKDRQTDTGASLTLGTVRTQRAVQCATQRQTRSGKKREEEEEQVQKGEQVQEEGQTERLLLGGSDGESDRGIATQTTRKRNAEMNPIHAVAGAASLAGQVAYLPVATVQNLMHNYNEINESTLSGAIDIIAVRQPDGCLKSTPFHVRFGRLQVVKPRDKVVTVRVNGVEVALKMKLGRSGEAYFVREADVSDESELDSDLAVSPIQSPRRASLSGSSTEASDAVTPPDSDTTHREIDALK